MLIGLTGSIGTGKSTVAAMFAQKGAAVIDADAITRALLAPGGKCVKKVAKAFGHAILTQSEIDRRTLSNIVFHNPRKLKTLTKILYPEALKEVKQQIKLYRNKPLVILDVPLLFEAGWDKMADTIITVYATQQQQVKRTQQRMGLSKADVLRRIQCQWPLKQKIAMADILIDNSGSMANTRAQVGAIIDRLSKRRK